MKLKDLLACAATGMILCTSCIKNEAPNAEADILNCTLPEGILTDAIINYNAPKKHKNPPFAINSGFFIFNSQHSSKWCPAVKQ